MAWHSTGLIDAWSWVELEYDQWRKVRAPLGPPQLPFSLLFPTFPGDFSNYLIALLIILSYYNVILYLYYCVNSVLVTYKLPSCLTTSLPSFQIKHSIY